MKRKDIIHLVLLFALASGMWSCSTKKNTWATRNYHQMKTKYNIFYNGSTSFKEGENTTREANEDDYSTVLSLYPVSNHTAAEAATAQMERTIEKCRKCIKLHSIKARPKIDYDKKRKNPEYAAWLEQEEFNNQIDDAWLLLGKAEFHKGDFLGSISTFNYVAQHYAYDPDVIAQCQLWIVRAYAEMGWFYEAEEMINKVQVDNLSRKNSPLYSAVNADLLLKTKRYKEAIPFVKIALSNESKKGNKPRFQYVLAQLYQLNGERENALNAYNKLLKMQPSNEMDFNARLNIALLGSPQDAIQQLSKIAKLEKNKDLLDQIYGTMGDVYLSQYDTVKALEYYDMAITNSTQNANSKAKVLITAGDIYYEQNYYIKASPCYKEATQILSVEHEQYQRIQQRSEMLDELVVEHTMVQLQDSLQRLSLMSEAEQRVIVDSIIARLIREEEAEKEREAQAAREANNGGGPRSVNTSGMLGGGGNSREWYFYNPQLLKSGEQSFRTQWGNRTLEDNWRRLSKATSSMMEEELNINTMVADSTNNIDSIQLASNAAIETDIHKPEYYLQQIPKTPADINHSNELLARALYNMVCIYRDQVGDQTLVDETFKDFCRRFPTHELLIDLYYMQYLTALKNKNMSDAMQYSQAIQKLFPDSREAYIVSQPDYFQQLQQMEQEQNSLYENTYKAYCNSQFSIVKDNKKYAEDKFPLSPLMPRFLFLNAIAVAKTDGQDSFILQLRDMVQRYPDNELAAMAKDMLALMGQGAESQIGESTALLERRTTEITQNDGQDSIEVQFANERNIPSFVILVLPSNEIILNQLLYEVALFNFTQFMIRDFDIKQLVAFGIDQMALQITGFEKLDDAEWYMNLLLKDYAILQFIRENQVQVIAITEDNYKLINTHFTIEDYLSFQ